MEGGKLDTHHMEHTDHRVQRIGLSDLNPMNSDDGKIGTTNDDPGCRVEILEHNQQALFETVSGEGPSADEFVDVDAEDD